MYFFKYHIKPFVQKEKTVLYTSIIEQDRPLGCKNSCVSCPCFAIVLDFLKKFLTYAVAAPGPHF